MIEPGNVTELLLINKNLLRVKGYSAAFMLLQNIHGLIDSTPDVINEETVLGLAALLENKAFESGKTAFFFYRETADALVGIAARSPLPEVVGSAVSALKHSLETSTGARHRGISEAMGIFPIRLAKVAPPLLALSHIPETTLDRLIEKSGIAWSGTVHSAGRSLIYASGDDRIAVVKFLKSSDSPDAVVNECLWMNHLRSNDIDFETRFDIPEPIGIKGSYLYRISHSLENIPNKTDLHPNGYAIAYVVSKDYFLYPNEALETGISGEEVLEMLPRNAFLMGKLLAMGIVHTAPVPLFHNRVQHHRRDDNGLYLWTKGGRLDRWLESCRYPNFGKSGLRDFEHLEPYQKRGRNLYETIGTHLLSFILVAGSYFRSLAAPPAPEDGTARDTRHLFDKKLLHQLATEIFKGYHTGFTGCVPHSECLFPLDLLTDRMIEEMGVDRHMEEILRVTDQNEMTQEEFHTFLNNRGYRFNPSTLQKGEKDITLNTGPHLGGFNRKISLPELIEFLETASALCITDKFLSEARQAENCASGGLLF